MCRATEDLEKRFHDRMVQVYQKGKSEAGYNANYFIQMVGEQGGLATARQLLAAPQISDGFSALWERRRLDLTVEACVLSSEFEDLFTDAELDLARSRLKDFGYRVD